LVEEADEFLLDVVAEKVESLCGYKPTDEQVLDFLKDLERKTELVPREATASPTGASSSQYDHKSSKKSPTRLVVTMPDGKKIDHNTAAATFAEVIEKLGTEQVKSLEHKVNKIPLISTSKHSKYKQRKSGQYYIITHSGTKAKKALLEKIASDLDIQLKVEIVDKS
jgi:negative regulator of replication initiation